MKKIEEMPEWMHKYIPFMIMQWDNKLVIKDFESLVNYIENEIPKSMINDFFINMEIKINLLEILYLAGMLN